MKTIQEQAVKFATLSCSLRNIEQKITALNEHKNEGSTPPHLEYKFKHLFKQDDELAIKASCIEQCINTEIGRLEEKRITLNNIFASRIDALNQVLDGPLQECQIRLDNHEVSKVFDTAIQHKKLEFILKQNKDDAKKQEKKEKFKIRQEQNQEPAAISTAELNRMKKEIDDLRKTVKSLKIKKPSPTVKPKNAKRTLKQAIPKSKTSTGGKKKEGGNRRSTAKNN